MENNTFDLDDYISQRKKRILIFHQVLILVMKNLKSE